MKERLIALRPWIIRFVGYPSFFVFWFVLFFYVTFPWDRLRETIIANAEAPRRSPSGVMAPSNMQLHIGSLGPTFLPGISARDISVTFLPTKAGERSRTMRIEQATVHVGLFALMANTLSADIAVRGLGGRIDGHVDVAMGGRRPGVREARLTIDNVNVGDIAPVVAMVGLPLSGRLDSRVDFHVPDGRLDRASGSVTLSVDNLTIGDGQAQYQIPRWGAVTIETIRAGPLDGTVTIRNGEATIERLSARSPEFVLLMDGRIVLAPLVTQSTLNASVRFQLTEVYRRKSETAGRIMNVMDFAPDLRAARRADGMYGFRCAGTLEGDVRCPPDMRGAASRGPAGSGGSGTAVPSRRGFEDTR